MAPSQVTVDADALKRFVVAVFVAGGVGDVDAQIWADMLVWANLRGVESHGVLRLPHYVDALRRGGINPQPNLVVERRSGAIAMIEGDRAPGPVALSRAMDEAMARARECHVGWCTVRNFTHGGAVGYYAQQAAHQGFAAIVMTASTPVMTYPGARVAAASTNPLAIAVPGGDHPPLMLDMSTATVSYGKILAARDAGSPIPQGWAVDSRGRPTTDPRAVAALLPLGGAKGAGLSLMIECLTSLLVANPQIAPSLRPDANGSGFWHNGVAIAIDIAAFGDAGQFGTNVDALAEAITSLPTAEGVERIYAPGERGDALMAQRLQQGVPLPMGTWRRLHAVADQLALAMPPTR